MIDPKKMLYCNIGWMEKYQGRNDAIQGGGRFIEENDEGGEMYNFYPEKGMYYGYVQPNKRGADVNIAIERLGARRKGDAANGVTVIWCALHPENGGTVVVGWYKNATVYRCSQLRPDEEDGGWHYRIAAKESDSNLLSPQKRTLEVLRGKGGFGQANICYNIADAEFKKKLFRLLLGKDA